MCGPLELEGYGVKLRRLTQDKIELVRYWRNDPKIQKYMEYREYITAEQQLAWFQRINNENNFYFIIEYQDKEVGLINIRDINYEKGIGEPGLFIWDDYYLNSDLSFKVGALIIDFGFDILKLQKLVIHVLADNKRAIQYNKSWGYKLSANQDGVYNQEYVLEKELYQEHKNKIVKYL